MKNFSFKFKYFVFIFLAFATFATAQSILSTKHLHADNREYTKYNNYVIFKQSFVHLLENKDLYARYPDEHWDFYKYSPTFSLFFGIFAWMRDGIGLLLWNFLNCLVFFYALWKLPNVPDKRKSFIGLFCLIELMTATQNEQSNTLIAGMLILAFAFFEREKFFWGILMIVLTGFIKIFGFAALILLVMYPQKAKNTIYTILIAIGCALLPVIVVPFGVLVDQYKNWGNLLMWDHSGSYGFSVMGWLDSWFKFDANKLVVLFTGALLLCSPLVFYKKNKEYWFRLFMLSSVLVWMVIFNHKAESPTFIIAVAGVALWYFSQEKLRDTLNIVLVVIVAIFTVLSPTDIFPRALREAYVYPYALKGVACIFLWFKLMYDLLKRDNVTLRSK